MTMLILMMISISEPDVTCLRVFTNRCAGSMEKTMEKTSETWIGLMGLGSHTPNSLQLMASLLAGMIILTQPEPSVRNTSAVFLRRYIWLLIRAIIGSFEDNLQGSVGEQEILAR